MRLLSLDLSISSTGYSVYEVIEKNNFEILTYGRIPTNKIDFLFDGEYSEDLRTNYIGDIVNTIIEDFSIDKIVIENTFVGGNNQISMSLKKLVGVVSRVCYLHNIIPVYFLATSWRKILGIKGNKSEKKIKTYEYVKENIIDIGELKSTGKDKNEDIYDSLAIGYAYLKKFKFIV